jgi:uncharacterized protein YbjT (DUF2867 family)
MAGERPLILVIGATGVMGREVMRSLAGRARLRALVHSDLSDAEIARRYPQAERGQCDLLDADSLDPAFVGVDRVLLLTPSVPEQALLEENALNAALAAGVRRIVYVSSTDVEWEIELSAAHRVMEARLAAGDVDHTVVRPEYLLDNLLGEVDDLARGELVAPSADGRCPFVDARDVGAVAAAVLLGTASPPGPLVVTGPESLSWAQLAERLGRALGSPVEHIDLDAAEWERGAVVSGMGRWLARALAEYFEALRERPLESSDDVMRVTGRAPRSVEDFVSDVLAPAVPPISRAGGAPEDQFVATIPTTHRSQHA